MTRCNRDPTKISLLATSLFAGIVLACCCRLCVAQDDRQIDTRSGRGKILQMVRTATPPVIDGVMDEVWNTAAVVEDLHQVEPIEYALPSEKTVIRVLFDEDFLYVSGMMYYSDPGRIVANKMIQGSNLRLEDKLRLYINPFNDGRNGYIFQTNRPDSLNK